MAGPWLVGVGIDRGIPALVDGNWVPLLVVAAALLAAAGADARLRAVFLLRVGRIGQAVLLDLRRRLFDHVQRLSPAFHERYTSGRVIARLTSDVDALDELLDEGLDGLVSRAAVGGLDRRHPAGAGPAAGAGHAGHVPAAVRAVAVVPEPLVRRVPADPGDELAR